MTEVWWPDDDRSIHQMGLMVKAAMAIADMHDKTVEEVMEHVLRRWKVLIDLD